MESVGRIEAASESAPIDPKRWLAMIDSHRSLAHVPPRKRPNPFKPGEMMEVKSPASTANVSANGRCIGSIWWAMDGSPILCVHAEDKESIGTVSTIAEEIAVQLGARFVMELDAA
jgi:hypothetical protein